MVAHGPVAEDDPAAVLNGLFEVVRAGGGMGIPGIYTAADSEAKNKTVKKGACRIDLGSGQRTGRCRTGGDRLLKVEKGESRISVEGYAVALVDGLERPAHIRQRFTVAY